MGNAHRLFFVMGVKKSGTTWLQHLLNAHPNVHCFGEGYFHRFGQHLLQAAKAYNAGLEEKVKIFGGSQFSLLGNEEFVLLFRTFILERLSRNLPEDRRDRLMCIGEKDPDHCQQASLMMQMFPEATYIHIVRDPRDAAVSWWHHILRFDSATAKSRYKSFEAASVDYAKGWEQQIRRVRSAQAYTRARYVELQYEQLLASPAEVMTELFKTLGVPNQFDLVSKCVTASEFSTLSGGRKPGEDETQSFFRKGVAGDWKNHMSPDLGQKILSLTKGLAAELRYSSGVD